MLNLLVHTQLLNNCEQHRTVQWFGRVQGQSETVQQRLPSQQNGSHDGR
jgi:hypothetical protein